MEGAASWIDASEALLLWTRRLQSRSKLSNDDLARLASLPGRIERVPAYRDFVKLGQPADTVSLVITGAAAQFDETSDGRRQIVALHLPGEMADLQTVVLPKSYYGQTALTNCSLFRIRRAAFDDLAREAPQLVGTFWQDCSANAAIVAQWLMLNSCADAFRRVAHLICELAVRKEALGGDRGILVIPLTQAGVGDIVGLTAVHVNRNIKRLKEAQLIKWHGRELRILDWKGLVSAAHFDAKYLHLPDMCWPSRPASI